MISKLFIFTAILFTTFCASAQELRILDVSNNRAIISAVVRIAKSTYVTDGKGKVRVQEKGVQHIVISHLNYGTSKHKVDLSTSNTIIQLIPEKTQLEDIVVTGQFSPQSAKNSVYTVKSIDQATIANRGAITIQDVLATEFNISFNRDNATGSSSLSLQGISGQNIKILMDGVPIAGRSGTQNEVDISQIDINTVNRIEIVEGPMSTVYGADALAGVINIITKKDSKDRGTINFGIHEESVAKNYAFFDEGIHNFNISANRKLGKNWFAQLGGAVNQFGGWTGNDENYDSRNRLWYPKKQYFGNVLLRYASDKWEVHYRTDYSNSLLNNLGAVQDNGLLENTAVDEEYRTTRWIQQVQSNFDIGCQSSLNTILSYSKFNRETYQYNKYLESGQEVIEESMTNEQDSSYLNTFFVRASISTPISEKVKAQIGVDVTHENGENSKLSNGEKSLSEVNIYASAEATFGSKFKLRPGLRYGYHSIYKTPITPSLNFKYNIDKNTLLRAGYGRGFRAPALTELYYEFVDANHRIYGNENIEPEYSHNINGELSHSVSLGKVQLGVSLASFYNYIDNRITYVTPQQNNPDNNTILTNLLLYKTKGVTSGLNSQFGNTGIRLDAGLIGRYQQLNENSADVPQFAYTPELTANIEQNIPEASLYITANYKYTGAFEQYVLGSDDTPTLQTTEAYHWLNLTANKTLGKSIKIALGIKNLLDVQDINVAGSTSGSTHASSGTSRSVGYGRSYFLKLNYNLNLK